MHVDEWFLKYLQGDSPSQDQHETEEDDDNASD